MLRFILVPLAIAVTASGVDAAEASAAPVESVQASVAVAARKQAATLPELEAKLQQAAGPRYWSMAPEITKEALALVETNTLTTGDEFFRAGKLVVYSDNGYRTERSRYELRLSAAALGNLDAEKDIAGAWDRLLGSVGRPRRTDFDGLAAKQPEFYQLDPAPASVAAVLRDPAGARATAKTAELNQEMKDIVDADQADRRTDFSKLTKEEHAAMNTRDFARNKRTQEIMHAGGLHTLADFANASLVMQHSAGFSGYQTAHELAVCAMLLGDRGRGRWLIAATYDRMLRSIGHDQRFGTQYSGMDGIMALGPVDSRGLCDAERKALGCPTLEEATNRNLNTKGSGGGVKVEQLIKEFTATKGEVRDPKYGLAVAVPKGWALDSVLRWGDRQHTLHFEIAAEPAPVPSLYYRVYNQRWSLTPEAMLGMVHGEVEDKQVARRKQYPDYKNRADSFKHYTVGAYAAFSWVADYTSPEGEKWAEYFVRLQTEFADASFFLQTPANKLEALSPAVDEFMAGLTMPKREK